MNRMTMAWSIIVLIAPPLCAQSSPIPQLAPTQSKELGEKSVGPQRSQADSKNPSPPSTRAVSQFNTAEMAKVIKPVTSPILPSIASIEHGKRRVALGIVVSSDGKILTKLSNLRNGIQVDIGGTKYAEIKVLGIHKQSDLAMLKINATDLQPAEFAKIRPKTGSWLISPTLDDSVALLGTYSAKIERRKLTGFFGVTFKEITLENDVTAVQITRVVQNSAAAVSGFFANDIIKSINGQPVSTGKEFLEALSQFSIAEAFPITAIRNGTEITKLVELTERSATSGPRAESIARNVRTQFPVAFGHDTKLTRNRNCGGPIIDLSGQIVGINMLGQHRGVDLYSTMPDASAQRGFPTMSTSNLCLAIPSEHVLFLLDEFSDGRLSPTIVNREFLEANAQTLEEFSKQLESLNAKAKQMGQDFTQKDRRKRSQLERKLQQLESDKEKLTRGF